MIITVTDNAKEYFNSILSNNPTQALYLTLNKKGCNGNSYDIKMINKEDAVEKYNSRDMLNLGNGVLVIDPMSSLFLFGTEVDWVDGTFGSHLVFNNPNVTSSCGCGESVSF